MMNKLKKLGFTLLSASLLAACSSASENQPSDQPSTDDSETTEKNQTTQGTEPEVLSKLMEVSGDDTQAAAAWKDILVQTARNMNYCFQIDGDGEDYLYVTDQNSEDVKSNFIYDVGRDVVVNQKDGTLWYTDLTDIDDSYDAFVTGFGTIAKATDDQGDVGYFTLSSSDHDTLQGTLQSSVTGEKMSQDDLAASALSDALMNYGYIRSVDPIHNSSLYQYDLSDDIDGYKLALSVKSLDELQNAQGVQVAVTASETGRPELVLNEAEGETWNFYFDQSGNLTRVENQVFHVAFDVLQNHTDTWMSLYNNAKIEKGDADELNVSVLENWMNEVSSQSIKDKDSFTLADWD